METLCVPGTLDSLSTIGRYVLAAAEQAGLDKKSGYRLRLAVDEIATNSIVHGYEEAGLTGDLTVRADTDEKALTIFLEDAAREYDPRQTALPDNLNRPLEERKMGGLGVYLTVQGVDTFLYERVGDHNRNIFVMNRPSVSGKPASAPAEAVAHLLLVDNSELDTSMISRQLGILGYAVAMAKDAPQAFDLIRMQLPDLVLLDANLPDAGTDQVLGHMKQEARLQKIPVILISYHTQQDLERLGKYLELGADDYLVQPFSPLLLQRRITAALDLKRLHAQEQEFTRNAELLKIEHDVAVGHEIQTGFLPCELPQPAGWELVSSFQPAREVAGDFYDAFMLAQNRRVGFLIGDVCDKGVGAALFMALFRSLLRAFAQQNYPERDLFDSISAEPGMVSPGVRRARPAIATTALKEAVLRTNNYIIDNHGSTNMFATLFFGILDPVSGTVAYINGGHNPPVILNANGIKERLQPTGPAVGFMPDGPFQVQQTQLQPGDMLYLFTDGVTDAKDPNGKRFSEKRMLSLVTQPAPSAAALLAGIEASLRTHISTAAQFDDITMLAVRRLPLPGS